MTDPILAAAVARLTAWCRTTDDAPDLPTDYPCDATGYADLDLLLTVFDVLAGLVPADVVVGR